MWTLEIWRWSVVVCCWTLPLTGNKNRIYSSFSWFLSDFFYQWRKPSFLTKLKSIFVWTSSFFAFRSDSLILGNWVFDLANMCCSQGTGDRGSLRAGELGADCCRACFYNFFFEFLFIYLFFLKWKYYFCFLSFL